MYALCFYLTISELDSSYLDQHVLLLVWGVPSLMHHGSQLRSLKTTDWLLTALWLQTFWFHQVNKVIPLYVSSNRILPQHLGFHAMRFHEFIWNFSKFINLTLLKFMPFVIVRSLSCSVQWPCYVYLINNQQNIARPLDWRLGRTKYLKRAKLTWVQSVCKYFFSYFRIFLFHY